MIRYSVITFFFGLLLASCGSNENSNQLSGDVHVDGSGTVYPVTEAVAEEFRNVRPRIRVTVGSSGSGAGFRKFARGETDISNASRPITDEEQQAAEENNIQFMELSIALDGIAVIVNPENDWMDNITTRELRNIWEPGSKVNNWNDIRPDWPDQEIQLYGPNTAHGTYDFFTETVMGESGASRSDYNAVADYNVAVQGISTDRYALGYFGLAYYEENQGRLKLIGIDNGDGPITPSVETISAGDYVLSRPLYLYVAQSAAQRPEVQSFIEFYLDNAGALVEEVGYVRLPTSEYDKQKEEFETFYSGSEESRQ